MRSHCTAGLGNRDVPQLVISSVLAATTGKTASITVATTEQGISGLINETQVLTFSNIAAGTFTLSFGLDVTVDTAGGDDTVLVDSLPLDLAPARLKIATGAGNDYVTNAVIMPFASRIVVDGGANTDSLEDYAGLPAANVTGVENNVQVLGIPTFIAQGPSPIVNPGQGGVSDIYPVTGAINDLAI